MIFTRGFTLIELLIVIAVVGIMAGFLYTNFGAANAEGRDAKRQADLRNLQTAVELYKQRHGRYPAMGCTPGTDFLSSESDCPTYIAGLAPGFISRLPYDPRKGTAVGYAYVTNSNGNAYKLIVTGTVETETVTPEHEFASCDMSSISYGLPDFTGTGTRVMCEQVIFNGNNPPTQCQSADPRFLRSYAVWGGYVPKTAGVTLQPGTGSLLDLTQQVICR